MEPEVTHFQDQLRIVEKCSDVPLYVHSVRQVKQDRIQLESLPNDRKVTSKSVACCLTELTYVLYNLHQLKAGALTIKCQRQPSQLGQPAQLEDIMHIEYSIKASGDLSFSMEFKEIFEQYFQPKIAMLKPDETKLQLQKLSAELSSKATNYEDRREEFIKYLEQLQLFTRHSRLLEISNNSLLQKMINVKWASGQNGTDELMARWRMEKCSIFISLEDLVEQATIKFKGKEGDISKYILEHTRTPKKTHFVAQNKQLQEQLQELEQQQWQKDNIINMLIHLGMRHIKESDPTTKSAATHAKVSLLFEHECGKETVKFQILFDPDKGKKWVIVKLFGRLPLGEKQSIDNMLHNCVFINQRLPGEYSLSVVDIVDFGKCLCIKMQSQINMRQTLVDRIMVLMETALLAYRIVRQDVQLPDIHRYEKQVFDNRKYIDHYTSYFHCIYNSFFVDSPQ